LPLHRAARLWELTQGRRGARGGLYTTADLLIPCSQEGPSGLATVSPSILHLKASLEQEVPRLKPKACLYNSTDGAGSRTGLAQMQVILNSC